MNRAGSRWYGGISLTVVAGDIMMGARRNRTPPGDPVAFLISSEGDAAGIILRTGCGFPLGSTAGFCFVWANSYFSTRVQAGIGGEMLISVGTEATEHTNSRQKKSIVLLCNVPYYGGWQASCAEELGSSPMVA